MSGKSITSKGAGAIIAVTWVLSLVTTLFVVSVAPGIFPLNVKSGNVASDAILTTNLADGSVTSAKILDGTVTTADIADNSISSVKILDGAITQNKIANGATGTNQIADGAILTTKIADGQITSAKILDGSINAAVDLSDGSIISAKIADGAISTQKIANGAVTSDKLAPGAIAFKSAYLSNDPSNHLVFTDTTYRGDLAVSLNLNRASDLVITFSAVSFIGDAQGILCRVVVDKVPANPPEIDLANNEPSLQVHSFTFLKTAVPSGPHLITVEVHVSGGTGNLWERSLVVIGLPA